ncbi:MAG: IS110 family transposase [Bacteroidota bacterium]
MKKHSLIIGIDISKLTLDIVGIDFDNQVVLKRSSIDNTKTRIGSFLKKTATTYGKENILVVFENTGVYGYFLASVLHKLSIGFCNLSALEVYRSSGIKRGKSDAADALKIARYGMTNYYKLELSSLIGKNLAKLKVLYTQRDKIVATISSFGNNREMEAFLPKTVIAELASSTKDIIKNLRKNLKKIEKQILEVIEADTSLKEKYRLAMSVPGVGPQTATYILIVTKGFTTFDNARQLACYAGVAPFPYQSGTSIKGRNKVSHLADKKLKSLLNMCAMNAKKSDPQLRCYFNEKVEEGKNKMLVLNNIRNKVLHRVFAVVKRGTPYVNTYNFAT